MTDPIVRNGMRFIEHLTKDGSFSSIEAFALFSAGIGLVISYQERGERPSEAEFVKCMTSREVLERAKNALSSVRTKTGELVRTPGIDALLQRL